MNNGLPEDKQWSEEPSGKASKLATSSGWVIVVLWFIAATCYGAWEFLVSDEPQVVKFIAFGGWSGFGALFLSVLLDRLKTRKYDRYRKVEK